MAWTRIDDKFLMNTKVQSVGIHGMALYLSGLIYCNGNLTDGFILEGVLPMLCGMAFQTRARKIADKLLEVNLWELVEGGYQIHDFLTFNKSKDEIELMNKARANNGAKGGRLAKQTETKLLSKQVSKQPPINPKPLSLITKPIKDKPAAAAFNGTNAEIYNAFASGIAEVTLPIQTALDRAVDVYSVNWVKDAIAEGVRYEAKSIGYVEKVLARWKSNGRNGNGTRKPDTGANVDKFKQFQQAQGA